MAYGWNLYESIFVMHMGWIKRGYPLVCVFLWKEHVFVCVCIQCASLWSQPVVLVIVAVDGYTAVVGDRPWHGCHTCDDACCRVITQDGVCCFTIFPSATKNKDLTIAHWHATALLQGRERKEQLQLKSNHLSASCIWSFNYKHVLNLCINFLRSFPAVCLWSVY